MKNLIIHSSDLFKNTDSFRNERDMNEPFISDSSDFFQKKKKKNVLI